MRELTTVVGWRGRQTAVMPATVIVYVFPNEREIFVQVESKAKLEENGESV